jgi:hypothetical protein
MLVLAQAHYNAVVGSSACAAWLISATAPTVPRISTQPPRLTTVPNTRPPSFGMRARGFADYVAHNDPFEQQEAAARLNRDIAGHPSQDFRVTVDVDGPSKTPRGFHARPDTCDKDILRIAAASL